MRILRTSNTCDESRASALWGTGNRGGEHRSSALWGSGSRGGGRRLSMIAAMLAVALTVPAGAIAQQRPKAQAYVPTGLLEQAAANPDREFDVVVLGRKGQRTDDVEKYANDLNGNNKRPFKSIAGLAVELKGDRLLKLAEHPNVLSITPNSVVRSTAYQDAEMWRGSTRVDQLWGSAFAPAPQAPAIAVVDSGVEESLLDFGDRVKAKVRICSLCTDSANDGQGHGTMVAALAAGSDALHPGVAQNAPIVSIRTANADGQSTVADVISAIDWILANKDGLNIRVANFSLSRADVTSFRIDPLNKAVEKLWFAGVVVVAAVGNHGSDTGPVKIKAPASDPFVISVGALDQLSTSAPSDDVRPSWSAYGTSVDGISKPDLAAPGRYVIGAVPSLATMAARFPERVVAPTYMWMSGTSFAAPIVAGAAAQLLARHPEWTPDQVKGALMLSAKPTAAPGYSVGVGELDAAAAAAVASPPNPNVNLYAFVVTDSATGATSFDGEAWAKYVSANPTWTTAAWSEAAWSEAAWSEAAWSEAAWSEAAWSEAAWSEAAWSEAAWSEAAWAEAAWAE